MYIFVRVYPITFVSPLLPCRCIPYTHRAVTGPRNDPAAIPSHGGTTADRTDRQNFFSVACPVIFICMIGNNNLLLEERNV